MSKSTLSEIERGERPLDSFKQLIGLANALRISPSDLTRLPVPAPGNGNTDAAINSVRLALLAVDRGHPGGHVIPVTELRTRIRSVLDAYWHCHHAVVGTELPGIIRDLHTSIAAGKDVPVFLDLAVVLHSHATVGWLRTAGAPSDLRVLGSHVAKDVALERGTQTALGVAAYGGLLVLVMNGAANLAWAELDSVNLSPTDQESIQLAGTLALCRSFIAAVESRPAEAEASLEAASELARLADNTNAYGLGFCMLEVETWRLLALVEAGEYEQAVRLGDGLRFDDHPVPARKAQNLITYGHALARLKHRRDDAVLAFRRAEDILPQEVQRNQMARDALTTLVTVARRDAVGNELRGLAYRAGVPA